MSGGNTVKESELLYYRVVDLWRRFCEEHAELLDATIEEYGFLLSSDIKALEAKVKAKEETIGRIVILEKVRGELIKEIKEKLSLSEDERLENVTDLLGYMRKYEVGNKNINHLEKFNSLLKDIIKKIQEQNKINQLFINKAMISLQGIRDEAFGQYNYSTYNFKGQQT